LIDAGLTDQLGPRVDLDAGSARLVADGVAVLAGQVGEWLPQHVSGPDGVVLASGAVARGGKLPHLAPLLVGRMAQGLSTQDGDDPPARLRAGVAAIREPRHVGHGRPFRGQRPNLSRLGRRSLLLHQPAMDGSFDGVVGAMLENGVPDIDRPLVLGRLAQADVGGAQVAESGEDGRA
jgi:hypothetical protein